MMEVVSRARLKLSKPRQDLLDAMKTPISSATADALRPIVGELQSRVEQFSELQHHLKQLQSAMEQYALGWAPGHFYSLVPDLLRVREREDEIFRIAPDLPGIDLCLNEQARWTSGFSTRCPPMTSCLSTPPACLKSIATSTTFSSKSCPGSNPGFIFRSTTSCAALNSQSFGFIWGGHGRKRILSAKS